MTVKTQSLKKFGIKTLTFVFFSLD